MQSMSDEGPLNFIKEFFKINFHDDVTFLALYFSKFSNNFLHNDCIIRRLPIHQEACLSQTNNFIHDRFKTLGDDFSNYFVGSVTKAYRSIIFKGLGLWDVRYETYVSGIYETIYF